MVGYVMDLFLQIFNKCSEWFVSLANSVQGGPYIIAGFIIFLCVSLLLKPLRGGSVSISGISEDFLSGDPIHKKKKKSN